MGREMERKKKEKERRQGREGERRGNKSEEAAAVPLVGGSINKSKGRGRGGGGRRPRREVNEGGGAREG